MMGGKTDRLDLLIQRADELFDEAEQIRSSLGDIAYAHFIMNCYDDLFNVQLPNIKNN